MMGASALNRVECGVARGEGGGGEESKETSLSGFVTDGRG